MLRAKFILAPTVMAIGLLLGDCGNDSFAAPPIGTQPSSQPATRPATQPAVPTEKVTIAGEEFTLEIAATDAARERGLMERTEITDHGGMIFIHPDLDYRSYWMANCPIDMDIMFLDANGRVVAMHEMKAEAPKGVRESQEDYEARLRRYSSNRPAQFAIELKAKSVERLKIKLGQMIRLDQERLKKMAE